jgi:isopenicillin-N epimerase
VSHADQPNIDHGHHWSLRPGVTYLNHGSFGPSPKSVIAARQAWIERLESEPMDFLVRQLETLLAEARQKLAPFCGTSAENLLFVDNATFGMNIVAQSLPLAAGDEILLTDHEYGAVTRIWRRVCEQTGAILKIARLPDPITSRDDVVDAIAMAVTPQTRVAIISHVTSPTAVTLPVAAICRRLRSTTSRLRICIDGPHAPGIVPLEIDRLDCDFYAASGHKWLSGPFGSGFLYVHPRMQRQLRPLIVSWGDSLTGAAANWRDEFTWLGTRDPSPFLALPVAVEFLEKIGLETFRETTHSLAQYAREKIVALTRLEPLVPDSPEWYGPMIALPLPAALSETKSGAGRTHSLQVALWERDQIEIPVTQWRGRRFLRVSCHLYNNREEIDRLTEALRRLL